ncbi:MAG: HemK2/MTQ2 family protein methyltransferase, partial [Candidatus Hodarchaeota archaeon]
MIRAIQIISKKKPLIDWPCSILEIGTGSGILSIHLMKIFKGAKFVATDISLVSGEIARENIINNLPHPSPQFNIIVMDLFAGFQIRPLFDLILFNPPYVPTSQEEMSQGGIFRTWAGGQDGTEVILRFLHKAPKFLVSRGQILLLLSSLNRLPKIRE